MKGVDFAVGNYVKAFKDRPFWYRRLKGSARGFYWLLWMEAGRDGLIGLDDTPREQVGEALALLFNENAEVATHLANLLFECGAIQFSAGRRGNAVVVVDYVAAQTTPTLDKVRAQQYRQRKHDDAVSSSSSRLVTPRHASSETVTNKEEIRREEKRKGEISPIGESEGDKPPRTDPTPSLLGQKFDEAVGRGPASWGMEGSGPSKSDPAKDPNHPTPKPAAPSPPSPRPAPRVAVVDPKPIPSPDPPLGALFGGAALEPPAPAPKGTTKRKPAARKSEEPVEIPLPKDWAPNDGHYKLAAEKYGFQKKHVDFLAEEMRDKCEAKGVKQVNWDAKFRTWMGNAWKWNDGKPPVVPDPPPPPEPKRPMPPPPPRHPEVEACIKRAGERMAAGETIDLKKLFMVGHRFEDEPEAAVTT